MKEWTSRTALLLTEEKVELLSKKKTAIFGVGGVGGFACEALARVGIGHFVLVDNDKVSISNINRQIIATTKTIGLSKVEVMKQRILDINPNAIVETKQMFYLPENNHEFDFKSYDYIIDAIDTITAKIDLAVKANELHINIISSMGAGNKLNPMDFEVTNISKTSVCPLAKVMRHELKKRGITKLKVVYSKEKPLVPHKISYQEETNKRQTPGSISFVPSTVGLIIASEVVKDIIKEK